MATSNTPNTTPYGAGRLRRDHARTNAIAQAKLYLSNPMADNGYWRTADACRALLLEECPAQPSAELVGERTAQAIAIAAGVLRSTFIEWNR